MIGAVPVGNGSDALKDEIVRKKSADPAADGTSVRTIPAYRLQPSCEGNEMINGKPAQ